MGVTIARLAHGIDKLPCAATINRRPDTGRRPCSRRAQSVIAMLFGHAHVCWQHARIEEVSVRECAACEKEKAMEQSTAMKPAYTYAIAIHELAHDGDTVTCDIDLGFDVWLRDQKVRLSGIDTPEINAKDAALRTRAQAARDRANNLIFGEQRTVVDVRATLVCERYDATEKFGRILGRIVLADGRDVAGVLLAEGHARAYDGGKRG